MFCRVSDEILAQRNIFFLKKCKEHGLRCTPQKKKIYDILSQCDNHPTAQEIYEQVRLFFPDLSFATVYKNLALFADKKMIQVLDFGEGVSRYDAEMSHHCHVYNTKTQKAHDVWVDQVPIIPYPEGVPRKSVKRIDITYFI